MYCNNCGAKLTDGAKFCNACGAPVPQTAAPAAGFEREDQPVNASRPAAPQQPSAGAAQTATPQQAPVYGAAQQGAYAPPQGQPGYAPQQGSYPYPQPQQPGYPQPGPGYPQPQQGAYGYCNQAVNPVPPKKKSHAALIAVFVILGVIVLLAVALVLFLKLRYEEPPLPPLTEPAVTETVDSDETEPASTKAAEPETTKKAEDTTAAPKDTTLSDAQAAQALDKLAGCWNTADDTQFVCVTKMEGGLYYLTAGYWYSEADLMGYLRAPVKGNPDGEITLTLYFEGVDSEFYSYPPLNDPISFDLSQIGSGKLTWTFGGESKAVTYAGATMEEAIPPLY